MLEMTVEPPLVESVIDERSDGTIVVRESFSGDVKPVHARVEEGSMGVDVNCEQRKERKERESEHVEPVKEEGRRRNGLSPFEPTSLLSLPRIDLCSQLFSVGEIELPVWFDKKGNPIIPGH